MKRILISLLLFSAGCDRVIDELHSDDPHLGSMWPNEAPSTGNVTVTLYGAFCERPLLTFDDGARIPLNLIEAQQLVVTIPAHAIGEHALNLACDGRSTVSTEKFRYYAAKVALDARLDAPPADRVLGFGDFDGDGIDDMVGMYVMEHELKIFRGTRRNAFEREPIVELEVGEATAGIDLELDTTDRDGDGRADLGLSYTAANVRSAGSFFAKSSAAYRVAHEVHVSSTFKVVALGAADLDGDGIPDLVTNEPYELAVYESSRGEGGEQRVVLNDGYLVDDQPSTLRGDFNGDGAEDLLLGPQRNVPMISILGSATGDALTASAADVASSRRPIDLDGDRYPDLISVSADFIEVQRGIGPTELGPVEQYVPRCSHCLRPEPQPSAPFDLDGDGMRDFVFRGKDGDAWFEPESGDVQILDTDARFVGSAVLGRGVPRALMYTKAGELFSAYAIGASSSGNDGPIGFRDVPPLIPLADWSCFGRVGETEVVFGPLEQPDPKIIIREQLRGAAFGEERELAVDGGVRALLRAGYTRCERGKLGDDLGDFLLSAGTMGPPVVLRFEAGGGVRASRMPLDVTFSSMWILDDAIVAVNDGSVISVDVFALRDGALERTLSASFPRPTSEDTAIKPSVALLDMDDVPDLVYGFDQGVLLLYGRIEADGKLSFETKELDPNLRGVEAVRLIDLGGDRFADDLAVETRYEPRKINIYNNLRNGTVGFSAAIERVFDMRIIATCDLDADSIPDLIFRLDDGVLGYARALRGGGFGALEIIDTHSARPAAIPALNTCVDADGDGLLDLVLRDEYLRTLSVLRNASQ